MKEKINNKMQLKQSLIIRTIMFLFGIINLIYGIFNLFKGSYLFGIILIILGAILMMWFMLGKNK